MKKRQDVNDSSNGLLNRRSLLSVAGSAILASVVGGTVGNEAVATDTTDDLSSSPTVGAHYYTWYGRGDHVNWTSETPEDPTFGSYDSRDPAVIDQHLEWCREYGIDWLSMSWWGRNSPEDVTIRDHVLDRPLDDVEYSIFYETPGMLTAADDGTYDLDSSQNRSQLIDDVRYLANTYVSDSQYRRIDGRPVLYLYIAREFRGDIASVFEAMRSASPDGLYIIADLIRFGPPLETDAPLIEAADAVTSYNMYSPKSDINDNFVQRATDVYDQWTDPLQQRGAEFIPVVIPGYDDTQLEHVSRDNPPLEASPELFRNFCREAQPYVTNGANSLFITSFNEWYENTQIEPSNRYGSEYLEVVKQELNAGQQSSDDQTIGMELQYDRTVSEDELEDGIENPRELAIQGFAMDVLDETGSVLASYNIGVEADEPEFGSGAYEPAQLPDADGQDSSWRWFGGSQARTTIHLDSSLDDATSFVLRGGSAEGAIQVTALRNGVQTDQVTVDGRAPADYQFDFTTSNPSNLAINSYEVLEEWTAGDLEITANWSVSDSEGNLDTVVLQVFDDSGSLADAKTTEVSGDSASTTGTEEVAIKSAEDTTFEVVLTVVDTYGNSTSQTKTVSK